MGVWVGSGNGTTACTCITLMRGAGTPGHVSVRWVSGGCQVGVRLSWHGPFPWGSHKGISTTPSPFSAVKARVRGRATGGHVSCT